MELVLQPPRSELCGQCCVAMITGRPLSEVIEVFGKKRATNVTEVSLRLRYFGYKAFTKCHRLSEVVKIPDLCIMNIRWKGHKHGHWVVFNQGEVYDPSLGVFPYGEWPYHLEGEFKWYIEVRK